MRRTGPARCDCAHPHPRAARRRRAGRAAAGRPGRATRVAERLEGARCYNEFRGLLGYTGTFKGTTVSVQTTGMGAPSAAIVVEELAMLGAKVVIRILSSNGAVRAIQDIHTIRSSCAPLALSGSSPPAYSFAGKRRVR